MASSQAMKIQWKSLLTENTSPWKIARLVRFSIPNHGGFPYQTPRLLTGGFFPDATGGLPASDFWWFLLMTISQKGWSRWVCNGGKISEMVELPWIHHHLATNICRIFHASIGPHEPWPLPGWPPHPWLCPAFLEPSSRRWPCDWCRCQRSRRCCPATKRVVRQRGTAQKG